MAAQFLEPALRREPSRVAIFQSNWTTPVTIVVLGAMCALLLALPRATVATRSLDLLFSLLDVVHRVSWGHVPGRDFEASLGLLSYYLPASGYWVSGTYGAAVPTGIAILLFLLSPVIAHVLTSRLRPYLATLFAAFLLLILAVPMNLGDPPTALSFAMFYNRIGWVGIAVLLVMYLDPSRPRSNQLVLDTICATLLTLLVIYTKITYGMAALGFLVFMLPNPRQHPWARLALGLSLSIGLVLQLLWEPAGLGIDILMAAMTDGMLRGSWGQMVELLLANFADFLLLGLIAMLAFKRGLEIQDVPFLAFCMIVGFWLLNQNSQRWGIISIHAAAVVVVERALKHIEASPTASQGQWINKPGFKLFLLALLLPTIIHCAIALGLHTSVAANGGGRPVALPLLDTIRLANLWTDRDYRAANWYLETIEDGADLLSQIEPRPQKLMVIGDANPFAAALDLEPARRAMPELRPRTTLDPLPGEVLLSDVDTVLERVSGGKPDPSEEFYLAYVSRNFRQVAKINHWQLYQRERGSGKRVSTATTPELSNESSSK